jgi:hypothetical protein
MNKVQLDRLDKVSSGNLLFPPPRHQRIPRNDSKSFLIQDVREVFEIFDEKKQSTHPPKSLNTNDEGSENRKVWKLVLIGRGLIIHDLKNSIDTFL